MPDYGNDIRFGYFLVPDADAAQGLLDTAVVLDRAGFDLVGIQDHPYQRRFLDAWTLLSVIAARTENLAVFRTSRVCRCAHPPCWRRRPPASTSSPVAASNWAWAPGRSGMRSPRWGPRRTPGESVRALEEAVSIIRLMWSGERAIRFDGDFYSVDGVHPGPVPLHPIGIWIGGYKPRMLRLIGEIGDGWLPSLGTSTTTE